MNGVVLKTDSKIACVLCDSGEFSKIKNLGYHVGEKISFDAVIKNGTEKSELKLTRLTKNLIAASLLILILAGSVGGYAWAAPYSYVTIDVNPSMELVLNRFQRIIKVTGYNDDGETMASALEAKIMNETLEDAMTITFDELFLEEYIGQEVKDLVITVTSGNENSEEELVTEIESVSEENESLYQVETKVITISEEESDQARDEGRSAGADYLEEIKQGKNNESELRKENSAENGSESENENIGMNEEQLENRTENSLNDQKQNINGQNIDNNNGTSEVPNENSNTSENRIKEDTNTNRFSESENFDNGSGQINSFDKNQENGNIGEEGQSETNSNRNRETQIPEPEDTGE